MAGFSRKLGPFSLPPAPVIPTPPHPTDKPFFLRHVTCVLQSQSNNPLPLPVSYPGKLRPCSGPFRRKVLQLLQAPTEITYPYCLCPLSLQTWRGQTSCPQPCPLQDTKYPSFMSQDKVMLWASGLLCLRLEGASEPGK